jgi:outer membrane protein OmpA-like peptidoglycan-associated protein
VPTTDARRQTEQLFSRAAASISIVLALSTACAKPVPPAATPAATPPEPFVVLLPDADGKTGAVSVARGADERVLDAPYAAAGVGDDGRLQSLRATPDEVRRIWGDTLDALPPSPVSFLLYFLEGRDDLTPESQQVVQQLFAEIARRSAPEVVVIGHTDRVGAVPFNDALSLRRAQKVRDDLVRLGVAPGEIQVAGRGEREPLVATDDEVAEPRNRRVEISVR